MVSEPASIRVNRAPVLTLWATVVAERLGYTPDTALTLGRSATEAPAPRPGQLGITDETRTRQSGRRRWQH